jgi:precorrin-6B methylase 1
MSTKIIVKSSYQRAFSAWFSEHEQERRHQKKRKGARLIGFPEPPASPENIAKALDQIGIKKALATLGVHRSTIARWLAGKSSADGYGLTCWLMWSSMRT